MGFYFMEIWKDIKDYEGKYLVSNYGNVKRINRNGNLPDVILNVSLYNKSKYYTIKLYKNGIQKTKYIHHLVFDTFVGTERNRRLNIDHINNNPIDNRLENLQLITIRQNSSKDQKKHNRTSKYIGVGWHSRDKKWTSRIVVDKRLMHLGYFDLEHDAHLAYQKALKEIGK